MTMCMGQQEPSGLDGPHVGSTMTKWARWICVVVKKDQVDKTDHIYGSTMTTWARWAMCSGQQGPSGQDKLCIVFNKDQDGPCVLVNNDQVG